MKPKVTAVVRTFNRANLVGTAIKSVLSQTMDDFELIIVDDASIDDTPKVVEGYANKDKRIIYIRNEPHIGNVPGLNFANEMARGEYIAYLDDDDRWRPKKIEQQLGRFESSTDKVGLVTGGIQYWNMDSGNMLDLWIPPMAGNIYWKTLGASGKIFGPPSVVMIKKSVLKDVGGFRDDMPRGACQHLFRRIAKKYVIEKVDDVVLDYYYHRNAITSIVTPEDVEKSIKSMEIKIESTREDLEQLPEVYAGELIKLGDLYLQNNRFRQAYNTLQQASHISGQSHGLLLLRSAMLRMKQRIASSRYFHALKSHAFFSRPGKQMRSKDQPK